MGNERTRRRVDVGSGIGGAGRADRQIDKTERERQRETAAAKGVQEGGGGIGRWVKRERGRRRVVVDKTG